MRPPKLLTDQQVSDFERDGVLVCRGMYDPRTEIEPIQRSIHTIIGLLIKKYGIAVSQPPFSPESFDTGYQQLLAHDRKIGGEIYDAVKNIPAFVRLSASEKHDALLCQLRNTDTPGIANGGYGIRIDNPNEERYRAGWHQDYPSQLRSPDGLVFWSPLARVTEDMGPVVFGLGSHKDGMIPMHTHDPRNPDKTGAYALVFQNEEQVVGKYKQIAPCTEPGDLVIIDYATIHCSGWNRSQRSRWTMQMRYFNFEHSFGVKIGWKGCFAAGVKLEDVHPELIVD